MFAGVGILLCAYYVAGDREILSRWTAAGKIAARIPQAVSNLCPNLPAGAVLTFVGIPRVYRDVPVFATGLGDAIQREYPVKVSVQQYDLPLAKLPPEARRGAIVFLYRGGEHPLEGIGSLPSDSQ